MGKGWGGGGVKMTQNVTAGGERLKLGCWLPTTSNKGTNNSSKRGANYNIVEEQINRETKRRRVGETKIQRDKEMERQIGGETK